MPVLNPHTGINRDFDTYELMPTHNDMAAMLDDDLVRRRAPVVLAAERGRDPLPLRAARRGPERVAAHLRRARRVQAPRRRRADAGDDAARSSSTRTSSTELRDRQVEALELPRRRVRQAVRHGAARTRGSIVTSDHGELFGEDGYFGHGPIVHEKVLEVPFVEGLVP